LLFEGVRNFWRSTPDSSCRMILKRDLSSKFWSFYFVIPSLKNFSNPPFLDLILGSRDQALKLRGNCIMHRFLRSGSKIGALNKPIYLSLKRMISFIFFRQPQLCFSRASAKENEVHSDKRKRDHCRGGHCRKSSFNCLIIKMLDSLLDIKDDSRRHSTTHPPHWKMMLAI